MHSRGALRMREGRTAEDGGRRLGLADRHLFSVSRDERRPVDLTAATETGQTLADTTNRDDYWYQKARI